MNTQDTGAAGSHVNLIETVRTLMIQAGLDVRPYDTHARILDARTKTAEVQRHALNLYWTMQLAQLNASTTSVRCWLVPNGTLEDWLRLFSSKILPFAVKHQLPR